LRSVGFALQLAATTAGALLDYLVGRLTGALSLGIACWALLVLVIAAVLEFWKDVARDRHRSGSWYTGQITVTDFIRPISGYRWGTIVRAICAATFAGAAAYAFILAVITFRFVTVYNGFSLGKYSPFNQSVIFFVSNFQASAATAALIVGSFFLAMLLRSEILLPCGIGLVAMANAILIGLPRETTLSPGFRSQIAYSFSTPDGWLFRLPVAAVPWACAIPFAAGIAACWIVSGLVRS
jgi:hypothetical protein